MRTAWLILGLMVALVSPTRADVFGVPPPFLLRQVAQPAAAVVYAGPGDFVSYTIWGGLRSYSSATRGTKVANVCNFSDVVCADLSSDATTGALVITTIGGSSCASVTCTVKTLYDQTGGGHDMTNATIATRPILKTSCIGSLPCMQFANASPSFLTNGAISSMNQPYSFSEVFERTGDFGTTGVIISTQASGAGADYFSGSANTLNATAGSNATVTAADSTWHTEHTVYDDVHTASAMCLDGVHNTAGISPGSSSTGVQIAIGTQPPATGTLGMTGNLVEFGVLAGTISGANCTSLNSNEKTYWGF